jgi:hypothetical protein
MNNRFWIAMTFGINEFYNLKELKIKLFSKYDRTKITALKESKI